jgi:anaerobic selenocysteine-containing dehydrogenase
MIASVAGDQVLKLEGDPEHPASRGYSCAKGRAIPELHHHASRLAHPLLRGAQATWDACLQDLGSTLAKLRAAHGADAVGLFGGTGGAWDTLGWWASTRLVKALGTAQYYTVGTVDTAPLYRAAELVTGYHAVQPVWTPDTPGPSLALLLGTNPCVAHGYLGADWPNPVHRLREYRKRGGEVWTVDPRRTKTAQVSDRHLAIRPGGDVFLLAYLVREILRQGFDPDETARWCAPEDLQRLRQAVERFDLAYAAEGCGLAAQELADLLAAVRRHGKLAALAGTGVAFAPHALLAEWLRWTLLVITGSLDTPGGMYFGVTSLSQPETRAWTAPAPPEGRHDPGAPSRPDLPVFLGQRPATALLDEIEAGDLQALIVFGGNPLACLPDAARSEAALRSLKVLAVVDPFDNPLTRLATHVLPSTWILERSDIKQRPLRIEFSPAILPPVGDSRPGWWILGALAERLGLDLYGEAGPLQACDEARLYRLMLEPARVTFDDLVAAGKHGLPTPHKVGWFHEQVLGERKWRIAPRLLLPRLAAVRPAASTGAVLIAGRVAYATNSVLFPRAVRRSGIPPEIHVSADLAEREGLRDGVLVTVSTAHGQLTGPARIDADLPSGAVWMNHGWTRRNVNRLIGGGEIDQLTTQPYFSAIDVRIQADPLPESGARPLVEGFDGA